MKTTPLFPRLPGRGGRPAGSAVAARIITMLPGKKDQVAIEIVAYGPGLGMLKMDSVVGNRVAEAIKGGMVLMGRPVGPTRAPLPTCSPPTSSGRPEPEAARAVARAAVPAAHRRAARAVRRRGGGVGFSSACGRCCCSWQSRESAWRRWGGGSRKRSNNGEPRRRSNEPARCCNSHLRVIGCSEPCEV